MSIQTPDGTQLAAAVEALRLEVAQLHQRLAALESALAVSKRDQAPPPAPTPPSPAVVEPISQEILTVLAAAVAAYLGKKAPIRQIRLVSSAAWAQQGRVTIQASHHLQS